MNSDFSNSIRSMFAAIDSCQWHELSHYFHPNVEYDRPGYTRISGLDDLLDFYLNRRIIKQGQHTVETVCTEHGGRSLSVTGHFVGIDRQGKNLDVRFCDVYQLKEGKIIKRETFFNSPSV